MGRIANPHPLTPEERGKAILLRATSGEVAPDGKTRVAVYWQPVPGAAGYNLYRWKAAGRPPRQPLNKAPIRRVRTCEELKQVIPEGSAEWEMLARAFSSATVRKTLKVVPHQGGQARLDRTSILADPGGAGGLRAVSALSPGLVLRPASPCDAIERGLTEDEEAIFEALANANLKIRLAAGLATVDEAATPGVEYTYELRGVLDGGGEASWRAQVIVVAGLFALPDPPAGVAAEGGDRQVLVTWNRNVYATGYDVQRSTIPAGFYQLASEEPSIYDVTKDVHGEDLPSPRPGFLDWQRWDDDGLPISHMEAGLPVDGPRNGVTYHYRVASRDILGRRGAWSAPVWATPVRSTPPLAPTGFRIDENAVPTGLALSWKKVTRDVNKHQIQDATQTYRIYRAETMDKLEDVATLVAHLRATVSAVPTDATTPTLNWTDSDPGLVPPYGEKDFWYRLICVDAMGLASDPSAVLAGRVRDTQPPGPTKMVGSDGGAKSITVYWAPNSEPDLAGYQVYRSVCDYGKPYLPKDERKHRQGCDFVLVGQVSLAEAKEQLEEGGSIHFEDTSVPEGSPLCYAYWVRAFDLAQNLYMGNAGCPAGPDEYVCQRLYEETPPPVPIVSALKARNEAVLIEWIASPVQDLRAFHVYRSDEENGALTWVGGALTDGTVLADRWAGIKPKCEEIPAEAKPPAVRACFLDTGVEPNRVYWYRVSALDWLGNESEGADLMRIPAVSTFTFSTDRPPTPVVAAPGSAMPAEGCGLEVRWDPAFDGATLKGFLVFRSTAAGGPYRQVSGVVQGNEFADEGALRGTDYWYRVQAVDPGGRTSDASAPVKYRY